MNQEAVFPQFGMAKLIPKNSGTPTVATEKAEIDSESFPGRMFARTQDLRNEGLDWLLAHGIAWLEERILQWPPIWGADLHVLIYGDFEAPSSDLTYPSPEITVRCEKQEKTIVRGAMTVLEAIVKV